MQRRAWIGFIAAWPIACVAAPQAVKVDPSDVFDLIESSSAGSDTIVRVEDARGPISAEPQMTDNGVTLGEKQFRQPPPEALRQALENHLGSGNARPRFRQVLAASPVRLKVFEVRFVPRDIVAEGRRSGNPGIDAIDFLFRSLAQASAGGSQGTVRIEAEVEGFHYVAVGTGRFTSTPSSVATRAAFQSAVDNLIRSMAFDSGAPSGAPAQDAASASRP